MARPRKGRAKRFRGCGLCKPYRKAGNGGRKADRHLGVRRPGKHRLRDIYMVSGR